jgi:hypothetical protein
MPGLFTPPPDMMSPPSMDRRSRPQDAAAGDVFPQRPLTDEPRDTDWRFEVQWTVELLAPEQSRQAEEALYRAADEPGQRAPAPVDETGPANEPEQTSSTIHGQEDRS